MLERPLAIRPGRAVHLQAFADGTCLVVYADRQVALSCRMYDRASGQAGLFVTEGAAEFTGVSIRG